eukprot:TRINITY_DN14820_c0_g2_i3.p1 TRINITY_DN14820_c0_g2~~TRINITY_DN14820_c0_g2_i3.p1  ORF type:complete len:292 (+),score=49.31 TRINITY_DN14820_c0_g2_i3:138-1013(+)
MTSRPVCRFFNTDSGCRFGHRCSFQHINPSPTASIPSTGSSSCNSPNSDHLSSHNSAAAAVAATVSPASSSLTGLRIAASSSASAAAASFGMDEYGMCRDEGVVNNYQFDVSVQNTYYCDDDQGDIDDEGGVSAAPVIPAVITTPVFTPYDCRYFNSSEGCRYGPYCSYTHRRFPSFVIPIESSSSDDEDEEDSAELSENKSPLNNENPTAASSSSSSSMATTTQAENVQAEKSKVRKSKSSLENVKRKKRKTEFEGEGESLVDEGILKKVDELAKQWESSVKKPLDIYWG